MLAGAAAAGRASADDTAAVAVEATRYYDDEAAVVGWLTLPAVLRADQPSHPVSNALEASANARRTCGGPAAAMWAQQIALRNLGKAGETTSECALAAFTKRD